MHLYQGLRRDSLDRRPVLEVNWCLISLVRLLTFSTLVVGIGDSGFEAKP